MIFSVAAGALAVGGGEAGSAVIVGAFTALGLGNIARMFYNQQVHDDLNYDAHVLGIGAVERTIGFFTGEEVDLNNPANRDKKILKGLHTDIQELNAELHQLIKTNIQLISNLDDMESEKKVISNTTNLAMDSLKTKIATMNLLINSESKKVFKLQKQINIHKLSATDSASSEEKEDSKNLDRQCKKLILKINEYQKFKVLYKEAKADKEFWKSQFQSLKREYELLKNSAEESRFSCAS